jgi:hypothetical protein
MLKEGLEECHSKELYRSCLYHILEMVKEVSDQGICNQYVLLFTCNNA